MISNGEYKIVDGWSFFLAGCRSTMQSNIESHVNAEDGCSFERVCQYLFPGSIIEIAGLPSSGKSNFM